MKISPIGPAVVAPAYTELFSQPVIRSYSKSQKGRLLVNRLEPKDRVTISPEAKELSILLQQSRPTPPLLNLPITQPPPQIENPLDKIMDFLESIKQTIADKLSVPVEDITIIDQEQVYWPDTSMGNPQPGGVYAQVITPGYKITVQVGEDKHVSEFYAVLDGGSQLEYVVGSDPLPGQPPVVAIPEQRDPEPPDPTDEAPKTLPIAPIPPLQNPEQSISRDQIELFITDRGTHG